MDRIEPESLGFFCPQFADELVGGRPSQPTNSESPTLPLSGCAPGFLGSKVSFLFLGDYPNLNHSSFNRMTNLSTHQGTEGSPANPNFPKDEWTEGGAGHVERSQTPRRAKAARSALWRRCPLG